MSAKNKTMYKVAMAGLGRIALELEKDLKREKPCTHAGTYQAFENKLEVVGGYDPHHEKKQGFLEFFPYAQYFSSIKEMIETTKPHVLSIASPSFTHLEVFEELKNLSHYPKLIWLEKPVEISLKKALKIAKIAKKMGSFVLVNHERRFDSAYQGVQKIILDKKLGPIKSIHAMMYRGKPSKLPAGSGTLLEDGTHLLDILFFLTQEKPLSHTGKLEFLDNIKVEKRAYGTLYFKNFPVFLDSGGERKYFHFELDINLEQGRIRIGNGVLDITQAQDSPYYEGFKSLLPTNTFEFETKQNMFINLGQAICDFLEKGEIPHSSLKDALKVMELSHAIYKKWKV